MYVSVYDHNGPVSFRLVDRPDGQVWVTIEQGDSNMTLFLRVGEFEQLATVCSQAGRILRDRQAADAEINAANSGADNGETLHPEGEPLSAEQIRTALASDTHGG